MIRAEFTCCKFLLGGALYDLLNNEFKPNIMDDSQTRHMDNKSQWPELEFNEVVTPVKKTTVA